MPDRELISGSPQSEDLQFEAGLRPRRLVDFTGQSKLKENLSIAIAAARLRGEAMDHVLLYGPPGLGKTTLAGIIAKLIMPGNDPGGIILTIVLGIVGAMLGGWLGRVLGLYREGEAAGFIMAVVGAVILLGIYRLVLPGRTRV